MGEQSLLDMAAEVRAKRKELEQACSTLREVEGNWTTHAIAADEAEAIARDGLRHAWAMLSRLLQLANEAVDALKGEPT